MEKKVALGDLAKKMGFEVVVKSSDFDEIFISNKNVNRPGLQLTGFMDEFPEKRIQIIGNVEYAYYMSLDPEIRYKRFRGILSRSIPCIIFSYNRELTQDIIDLAMYYDKTIFRSEYATTRLIAKLDYELERYLAKEETIHAGLMEVYGSGVLIRGKSSVGKSETGLDLVNRGHRLVADDVVEIMRIDEKIIGRSPENIRHFMEIRGIGILDIRRLYGVGAVKTETEINIVIELENWNENVEYDRLGLDEHYTEIMGVKIPKLVVPVKPGRNIAMIIEVAIRNNRQKKLGYNSALELTTRLFNDINPDRKKEINQEYR